MEFRHVKFFDMSDTAPLKLGSHQAINPDSIAKLTINKKVTVKTAITLFWCER